MISSSYQVGGSHYFDKPYQPWDFILDIGAGYCEGNIIKYISRWRDKGGPVDVRKALHYAERLCEFWSGQALREGLSWSLDSIVYRYVSENSIPDEDAHIIRHAALWSNADDLERLVRLLRQHSALTGASPDATSS